MTIRVIDRAGGGLQTLRVWTPAGHIDRQVTATAGESFDVDPATLPAVPSVARAEVLAGGAVAGECLAPEITVRRGATTYQGVTEADVIEEDTPFRMRRRLSGTFSDGTNLWRGGDGNLGGGSAWDVDKRTNRPIKWSLWVETRAGMPGVWFRHRLENDGGVGMGGHAHPANDTFYDRLYVAFDRPTAGASLTLRQDHVTSSQTDEAQNFRQVLNGVTTTERHSGEVPVGGGWLAVKWFWEKYPKGVIVNGTRVEVDLFPDATHEFSTTGPFGSGNHLLIGSWSTTHDFAIGPTVEAARRLIRPPAAFPEIADVRAAWGPIGELLTDTDPLVAEALDRHSKFHRAVFSGAASSDGASVPVIREHRGYWPNPRQCVNSWYGEQRFGCVFKGGNPGQPAMNIYDWPYIMWLQALRHRSVELWELAEAATVHTSDYDRWKIRKNDGTPHGRPASWQAQGQHGVWNWEDGNFNSSTRFQHIGPQAISAGATGSHSWNGGDALGHLLTGDPTYLEGAMNGAEGWWAVYNDIYSLDPTGKFFNLTWVTTRAQSWTGLQWLNAYRVTGDPVWLDRALLTVRTLIDIESRPYLNTGRTEDTPDTDNMKHAGGTADLGGGAIVMNGPSTFIYDRGLVVVTFLMYPLEPIMEIHEAAKAAGRDVTDVEAFLLRSLTYLRTKAWKGGQVSADGLSRVPWQTSYNQDPQDPVTKDHTYIDGAGVTQTITNYKNKGGVLQYNHFAASLAAYCATKLMAPGTEADETMQWARELYRDQFLLVPRDTIHLNDFVPWTTRGAVNLGQGWPSTNLAKVVGWYGRGGQIFLDLVGGAVVDPPEPEPEPEPAPGEIMATINATITNENQTHTVPYTGVQIRFQHSTDAGVTWTDVQSIVHPLGTAADSYSVPVGAIGMYRAGASLTDGVEFSAEVFSEPVNIAVLATPTAISINILV